jgi:hypothetical protein
MIGRKIERAIDNLPVLKIEKDRMFWDLTAALMDPPDGAPGKITVFRVSLFAPAVGNDWTTQQGIIWDPFISQDFFDQMIAEVLDAIRGEQKAAEQQGVPADLQSPLAQKVVSQALSDGVRKSAGGLYLP